MSLENENKEKNRIIDNKLKSSGVIDLQLLASFDEAYNYDAASTINWLIAKLKILKEVIRDGKIVEVESSQQFSDIEGLNAWIEKRYPDIADDV